MTLPLLTALGVLPLLGSAITFALRGRTAKLVGLLFALATLALGLVAIWLQGERDLSEQLRWISSIGAWYALGLDGLGKVMVLVTVILVPVVMVAEWNLDARGGEAESAARWPVSVFFALVLMLQGLGLFVFMATDVLLFYIFFEATLVPMFMLIGGWGGPRRGAAALKFLLFSLAGGLAMLASVIGLVVASSRAGDPSLLVADLARLDLSPGLGRWALCGFLLAFLIKAPLVPFHSWLPDVAEETTPGSTVLLVGILDKIATFGLIRFGLGIFGEASRWASTVLLVLAIISILYGALMAVAEKNLMRLVSYTSVAHFGFMVFGIFAFTTASLTGTMLYMLGHALSSAALFLVAGFLVQRTGTADITKLGGVARVAPVLAGFFLISGLATLALPGFVSFAGEFMVLAGAWQRHPVMTVVATLGTVLAAVYVMLAYQRTMTGEAVALVTDRVRQDLTWRERAAVAPLLVAMLVFGLWPAPISSMVEPVAADAVAATGLSDPAPAANGGNR